MNDAIHDRDGQPVATIRDGEVYSLAGVKVGTARKGNVYDRNGKFIFHLQAAEGSESAGNMTGEAIAKLFHPK